ncbi:MAG: DUF2520 domain-containing protein [Flavobacteriia bacterium]|nr:DUF2520 domain-containing protein [Flavobacteriia bacterium]
MKKKITIIGSGNVAFHLTKELVEKNYSLSIYSRNAITGKELSDFFSVPIYYSLKEINSKDLLIVCVNDDQVIPLVNQLNKNAKVLYTSGSTSITDFEKRPFLACFYPMQTFNKNIPLDFKKIPIFVESTSNEFLTEVKLIAYELSNKVYLINSEQRLYLHIAAVFANNFSNFLQIIAQDVLNSQQIPTEVLDQLRTQTCEKWKNWDVVSTQTGPAKRNDKKILKKHLSVLKNKEKEIYQLLSNSILEYYGHEKL